MSFPKPLVLPPGVEASSFEAYLKAVTEVVGAENVTVIESEDGLEKESYSDPSKAHDMFHVFDKDYFIASAVVAPRKVTEVQAIMRLCNEFKIPVWPFSVGRNVGYGGAAPRVPGSVGLDMGRNMNRVLGLSEQNAYCLIEPGVTYQDLYDYVQDKCGDRLWIDVPDLGGGSVLGNCMERGVGYTPYGDHFMVVTRIGSKRSRLTSCFSDALWYGNCVAQRRACTDGHGRHAKSQGEILRSQCHP